MRRIAAVGVLMMCGSLAEAASGSSASRLEDLRIPLEFPNGGITVFSGTGRTIRSWEPTVGPGGLRYSQPDIEPGGEQVVAIQCEAGEAGQESCRLVVLRLSTGETITRLVPDAGKHIQSPVYSPDGKRIALVLGEDIALLDSIDLAILDRFPNVFKPDPSETASLRWSSEGKALCFLGVRGQPEAKMRMGDGTDAMLPHFQWETTSALGRLDLTSRKVEWANIFRPDFFAFGGPYQGSYTTIRDGYWTWVHGPLPDDDLIGTLFGSAEHPVLNPHFSPDRRYYFYQYFGQGWFSRTTIRRYDVERGRLKTIRTLERAFYRE